MSAISSQTPPSPSPEPIFRLSVPQYHGMIEAGVLTDDDPVELLEGILVFKMPKKPAHRLAVRKLIKALEKLLPAEYFVLSQEPVTLEESEPEPDAAVIRGREEDFASRHPGGGEVALVVEVADTTVQRDRTIKLRTYARAGIGEYWIVNLVDRTIERYSEPLSDGQVAQYARRVVAREAESAELVILGQRVGFISVSSILPPTEK